MITVFTFNNQLYEYNVNVSMILHKGNVLKEQNLRFTLTPCRTLCNSDFLDLGK